MKNKYFIIFLILLVYSTFAQTEVDRYYEKIEDKINNDKRYLDLYTVNFLESEVDRSIFSNIPKSVSDESFTIQSGEGVTYSFIYLPETIETDSLILLELKEIVDRSSTGEGGFFEAASGGIQIDTNIALSFRDLQNLYFENREMYDRMYDFVVSKVNEYEPYSLLKIDVDKDIKKSKGISGKNNQDYLNYNWVNSRHFFPKPLVQKSSRGRGRGRGEETAASTQHIIDASFSHGTYYNPEYMNFGFSMISAELNSNTKVLNLLPWQSMTMSLGIRTLITLSDEVQNIYDDILIDAKIMGRFGINMSSFSHQIPTIFTDPPKLNVGSGVVLDLHTSRIFGLPFINLYFAFGSKDVTNPYVSFGPADSATAFFTSYQWETTMSFYWNTSDSRNFRLRMDIGAGGYDVNRAVYYKGITEALIYNNIQPVINFHMSFVPKDSELLSANFKFFDGIIKSNLWFKVFELEPNHVFRFETTFMTSPFYRGVKPWENEGGASIQIRYRYGF
ncbi:MAG: hypothetical protein K9J16_01585 [Melioribacteraceae bacterium]|nr:hypothetical protein [Melioribacteraceae bacterium]MCF8352796.1 hypothetical protein [Melioribacteraceae bacterium]MCF8393484.1 hypothetical protein [Melioribacteraceae bacterium]MCF8417313.1 hypothetical protein [Melioribacteraceae bacterium]